MTISEIMENPITKPQSTKAPSPPKVLGTRPDEAIPISSSKKSHRSAEVVRDTQIAVELRGSNLSFAGPATDMDTEPESQPKTASKVFSRRVSGENLYGPGAKSKTFTQIVLLQVREEYFYTEYRVEQDPALEKKSLFRMESHAAALASIEENEQILAKEGYCEEEGEGYSLITSGAIQLMIHRGQNQNSLFKDLTQSEDVFQALSEEEQLAESLQLVEAPEIVEPEPAFEPLQIGENLQYDLMSHSDEQQTWKAGEGLQQPSESRTVERERSLAGELKSACRIQPLGPPSDGMQPVMLLQTYKDTIEVAGWLLSEKLDGVRCLWTGKQLITRNGRSLSAPGWFTRAFPNSTLDGELYMGRGNYHTLSQLLRKRR